MFIRNLLKIKSLISLYQKKVKKERFDNILMKKVSVLMKKVTRLPSHILHINL